MTAHGRKQTVRFASNPTQSGRGVMPCQIAVRSMDIKAPMRASGCASKILIQLHVPAVTHVSKQCTESSTAFEAHFQFWLRQQCRLQLLAGAASPVRAQVAPHEVVSEAWQQSLLWMQTISVFAGLLLHLDSRVLDFVALQKHGTDRRSDRVEVSFVSEFNVRRKAVIFAAK